MREGIILVFGSVKPKQYEPARLDLLQQRIKPVVVRAHMVKDPTVLYMLYSDGNSETQTDLDFVERHPYHFTSERNMPKFITDYTKTYWGIDDSHVMAIVFDDETWTHGVIDHHLWLSYGFANLQCRYVAHRDGSVEYV